MNFIDIGLVSSTFGNKGIIKLDIYYDVNFLYSRYKYLILRKKDLYLSYTIKNFYKKDDHYYFSLEEINNVFEAKKLVGFDVVIPENLKKEVKDSENELLCLDKFLD
ncbi:MAG: hypothetical protein SVN78_02255, partial [Deferribacterota bacterium]|nr:hypothetical protein [Deferribacterota bacterium]